MSQSDVVEQEETFDLRPDPRILPMLGEISLSQWRCLAELIDNSIDGFLSAKRAGKCIQKATISINLPAKDTPGAKITVVDNGPGMDSSHLEKAVRAGWSGNTPIDSLGLFGMGFNISTARLGLTTTVFTSQAGDSEEKGIRVDFSELMKQGHFFTPRLTRAKIDPQMSGTRVEIEKLKPEQRKWFAKPANRSNLKKEIAKAYSAMLRDDGVPIAFNLELNGKLVRGKRHCVWGQHRSVYHSRCGEVRAYYPIDRRLNDRPYCVDCWCWLPNGFERCPNCDSSDAVTKRERRVHGWIGLQRYVSRNDFGIDFIRNGRKIEIANRELFSWDDDINGPDEEYPVDDPRSRGRIVGEIHLDHCRVTYTKDRFERTDPAWEEMIQIIRGLGPLKPQKAADLGFGENVSPLYKLYQAFRRNSPRRKKLAGGWAEVLIVRDNELAEEMARKFHDGEAEYQDDSKWWELAEEEDRRLVAPQQSTPSVPAGFSATPDTPGDETEEPSEDLPEADETKAATKVESPLRRPMPSLTREYFHLESGLTWAIQAYQVETEDPVFEGTPVPWVFRRRAEGPVDFYVASGHEVFRSVTLTELDALLAELAHQVTDSTRLRGNPITFAQALASLREAYAGVSVLDAASLSVDAEGLLRRIATEWSRELETDDCVALFGELPHSQKSAIQLKMASSAIPNPQSVISEGRFLEYASPDTLIEFVIGHPELFFDGRCWEQPYDTLDYLDDISTEKAKKKILARYQALLLDVGWLIELGVRGIENAERDQILRAVYALQMLAPNTDDNE